MKTLDCKIIKEEELNKLKEEVKGINLKFAVIEIGEFDSNEIYLRSKRKISKLLNIELVNIKFNEFTSIEDIISVIKNLNDDFSISGIILQKPISSIFSYDQIVNYIDFKKDIDGLTEKSILDLKNGKDTFIPPTALSVLKILDYYNIELKDKKIALLGKSNILGMPLYNILKNDNEVILCDSKTTNLKNVTKSCDIIITGISRPLYLGDEYFTDGQVVIDVSTSYVDDHLVGDLDVNNIKKDISITTVPFGVGMLTPIFLIHNLIKAYKNYK